MLSNRQHISIIIVNYNGRLFLHDCLSGVITQTMAGDEVIVVDNGSSDGSAEYMRGTFPSVKLIECERNLGFAGGNNCGVKHAKNDLIVLLNNDTIVHQGWLEGLVNAIADDNVVAASSLIKTEGIPDRYYEKNGSINFLGHNIMRIFDQPNDIFFAGGASMIFKKNILGIPFDDDYFVYAEDVYLGLRSRFMGYRICHTNESALDHIGNGTSKKQKSGFLTYYQERNRILNSVLFFSPATIIKIIPFLIVNAFAKCCASLIGTKYSFFGLVKAYVWFPMHIPAILKKRARLRSEAVADEREVIRYMTGNLTNGESAIGKIINTVSITYCRLVNLQVIEIKK